MKYTNESIRIHSLDLNVKQVNKTKAKRLFEQGTVIYLHPCNMAINNPWMTPSDHKNDRDYNFDNLVNTWSYYNANSELGYYPNFFIEN